MTGHCYDATGCATRTIVLAVAQIKKSIQPEQLKNNTECMKKINDVQSKYF